MTLEEAVKFCEEHECEECPVVDKRSKREKEILHIPCCVNLVEEIENG